MSHLIVYISQQFQVKVKEQSIYMDSPKFKLYKIVKIMWKKDNVNLIIAALIRKLISLLYM